MIGVFFHNSDCFDLNLWFPAVNETRRARIVMGVVIVAMYLLATLHLALRWCYVRGSFIGPWANGRDRVDYLWNAPKWMLICTATFVVNTTIADFVVVSHGEFIRVRFQCWRHKPKVWRCWNVWGRRWIVAAIPSFCNVVGIGMSCTFLAWSSLTRVLVFACFSLYQQATTPPPGSPWGTAQIYWLLPYFCISVSVTVGCTSLIVFKIWNAHRETDKLTQLKSHRSYKFSRVICTLVESAAMYAASMIITLAFYKHGALNANFPIAITSTITVGFFACARVIGVWSDSQQGLAPTLIVARVTCGSTKPLTTWQEPPRSILEFNRTLDPINTFATVRCLDIHDDSPASSSSSDERTERDSHLEKEWKKNEMGGEAV